MQHWTVIWDAIQANKTDCIMDILGDLDVSIPCSTCGKRTDQTISRLKCHPSYVCAFCGKTILIDSCGLPDQVSQADKMIDGFQVNLRPMQY